MAKPLRGYTRLPGTARSYRTSRGNIISRYEYDSRRARAAGYANRGEVERLRQSPGGSYWHAQLVAAGADATYTGTGMRAARDLEKERAQGEQDTSADSALARLLVATGRRDPDWDWAVGDTPKGVTA